MAIVRRSVVISKMKQDSFTKCFFFFPHSTLFQFKYSILITYYDTVVLTLAFKKGSFDYHINANKGHEYYSKQD